MEARTAVMVVPIFVPIMKGKAFANVTFLLATKGTTKEVVTVLDWTAAVKKRP